MLRPTTKQVEDLLCVSAFQTPKAKAVSARGESRSGPTSASHTPTEPSRGPAAHPGSGRREAQKLLSPERRLPAASRRAETRAGPPATRARRCSGARRPPRSNGLPTAPTTRSPAPARGPGAPGPARGGWGRQEAPRTLAGLRVHEAVGDGVGQSDQLLGLQQLQQLAAPGLLPFAQPQRRHRPGPGRRSADRSPGNGSFRRGTPSGPRCRRPQTPGGNGGWRSGSGGRTRWLRPGSQAEGRHEEAKLNVRALHVRNVSLSVRHPPAPSQSTHGGAGSEPPASVWGNDGFPPPRQARRRRPRPVQAAPAGHGLPGHGGRGCSCRRVPGSGSVLRRRWKRPSGVCRRAPSCGNVYGGRFSWTGLSLDS